MVNPNGPVIDMTPDGRLVEPPKPTLGAILVRLVVFGLVLCMAALVFWTAILMIPFLLMLGVIGYFVFRAQIRRNGTAVFTFRR